MFNTVTVVGVGLISGSFSLALKDHQLVKKVIGVSRTGGSAQRALDLGIIDEVLPLEEAVRQSDLIYVAIPVDATLPVMKTILDGITEKQIVADAGSTKQALCEMLADHPMRERF
ncbi:MAG TPA: prephenate dehydrogenase/arogenate dehydrogenase family protein, partial [Puia sp.]